MNTSDHTLSPGEHTYDDIYEAVCVGRVTFAWIRTASGRRHFLTGISTKQLRVISALAKEHRTGFLLLGSRVAGPRSAVARYNPLLAQGLPLVTTERAKSATFEGVSGLEIHKTHIKELGYNNPQTSDLTILLVDAIRTPKQLETLAIELETRLMELKTTFQIRVFASRGGRTFRTEDDWLDDCVSYLRKTIAPDAKALSSDVKEESRQRNKLKQAARETYAKVNLPEQVYQKADIVAGLLSGSLLSLSFSFTLGLQPIVPITGFLFGVNGRYLARFRAFVSRAPRDTWFTNTLALFADVAIGVLSMALVMNPLGGYHIPFTRIVTASFLHTLSKGSVRLYLDKVFSKANHFRQHFGVLVTLTVNFVLGLATGGIYQGSRAAFVFQVVIACIGLTLTYGQPILQLARRIRQVFRRKHD